MSLYILRGIWSLLQLFAESGHKYSQGCYIIFPVAAPDILCNKGVSQNFADVAGKKTEELIFNRCQMKLLVVEIGTSSSIVYTRAPFTNTEDSTGDSFVIMESRLCTTRSLARSSSTENGLVR